MPQPSYISLSHVIPSKSERSVRVFVLPSGREAAFICKDATVKHMYEGIFRALHGIPRTKPAVIRSLGLSGRQNVIAGQIFDALVRRHLIADTTRLAQAFSRTWQSPVSYEPSGYSDLRDIDLAMEPYAVEKGLESIALPKKGWYGRRSLYEQNPEAKMQIAQLQHILADSYRTTPDALRPTPSPGSIYPVRLHVLHHSDRIVDAKNKPALAHGIYQYDPCGLSLERRTPIGFPAGRIAEFLADLPNATNPLFYIFISVDIDAFSQKYGNATLMFQGIVVGSVMQRLTDASVAQGLGSLTMFGVRHILADEILGNPPNIKNVLMIAIGAPSDRGSIDSLDGGDTPDKLLLDRVRRGTSTYILKSGEIDFGDPRITEMPNSFAGAWAQYSQKIYKHKPEIQNTFGTGYTKFSAMVKAIAEAVERIASSNIRIDAPMSKPAELPHAWIDPRDVGPLDRGQLKQAGMSPFSGRSSINWTLGTRIRDGSPVYAPASLIYYPYSTVEQDGLLARANSNGVAAHLVRHNAIENALFELIERDGIMRMWLQQKPAQRIDPASLPGDVKYRVGELLRYKKQVDILNVTGARGLPAFMAVIRGSSFPFFCAGAAARYEPASALHKALDEAVAGFSTKGMLYHKLKAEYAEKNEQGFFDITSHVMYYADDAQARRRLAWLFTGDIVPLRDNGTARPTFRTLVDAYNPAVFDIDNPIKGNGLHIVRVVSEDLIPLMFGYRVVPYLHRTLPPRTPNPDLPHFFD